MKYSCFTADSIKLMAEGASLVEPSLEVAAMVSEDTTFRLRQIIARAIKFMQHSKRTKLTCADINKALQWSDCQPVFGYECNPNKRLRYSYSTEAQVFRYESNKVDLADRYKDNSSKPDGGFITDDMLEEAVPRLIIDDVIY